jgi:hypothetical protein
MKTDYLVNGYVLPNLFYELIFLDEHGIDGNNIDWANHDFIVDVIRKLVKTRFDMFEPDTKNVVRNTLKFLLATEPQDSEIWDVIWQASSAPIPTPYGIRSFVRQCYDVIFENEALPSSGEVSLYNVNHDPSTANRLN